MSYHMVNYDLRQGGAERVFHTLSNVENNDFKYVILNNQSKFSYLNNKDKVIVLSRRGKISAYYNLIKYFYSNPGGYICFKYNIAFVLIVLNVFMFSKRKVYIRVISSISRELAASNLIAKICILSALKYSCKMILQSKGMINDALVYGNGKYKIINNPICNKVSKIGPVPYERFILFVGRINPVKQIDHIILAFHKSSLWKEGYKLLIVGDGCFRLLNELKSLVSHLDIENFVVFVGGVKNVSDYYSVASALVLTSKYEGFPNVLAEAIHYDTPVLSYDCVSGPSEIIIDGVNGFLIVQNDIEMLSRKMVDVLSLSGNISYTLSRLEVKAVYEEYLNFVKE